MHDYTPISCDFHSHLESWAVKREVVSIIYLEDDKTVITQGLITDLYTIKGEEFMLLDKNKNIRLDHIVEVNNLVLSNFNSCGTKTSNEG